MHLLYDRLKQISALSPTVFHIILWCYWNQCQCLCMVLLYLEEFNRLQVQGCLHLICYPASRKIVDLI